MMASRVDSPDSTLIECGRTDQGETTMEPDPGQATSKPAAIASQIEQAIRAGHYQAGDRLPSRTALAAEFGVGETTIVQALNLLKYLGLVRGQQGRTGLEVLPPQHWTTGRGEGGTGG